MSAIHHENDWDRLFESIPELGTVFFMAMLAAVLFAVMVLGLVTSV